MRKVKQLISSPLACTAPASSLRAETPARRVSSSSLEIVSSGDPFRILELEWACLGSSPYSVFCTWPCESHRASLPSLHLLQELCSWHGILFLQFSLGLAPSSFNTPFMHRPPLPRGFLSLPYLKHILGMVAELFGKTTYMVVGFLGLKTSLSTNPIKDMERGRFIMTFERPYL